MSSEDEQHWNLTDEVRQTNDPLMACLLMLGKHFQTPASAESLKERLPLVNNLLTPELFVRAAPRIGLDAEINVIDFDHIDPLALPAVLILTDNRACILLEKNEDSSVVLLHSPGEGVVTLPNVQLKQDYNARAIFVKRQYKFTGRSQETVQKPTKEWFWAVVRTSWPIYLEVFAASIFVNVFALALPLFTMNVYDRVVPNQSIDTMWVLASGIALVFIFDFFLKSLRSYFIDVASKKIDVHLSAVIFEKILGVQMNSRPTSVGAFANTIQSFETFREFITSTTITVLVDLPFVFLYLAVIFFLAGSLVFVPLAVIPVIFVLGFLLQYPLISMTKESYKLSSEKQATLIESLSGIEAIKSSGAEGVMQRRFEQVVLLAAVLGAKLRMLVNSSMNITNTAQQVSSVLLVVFGVYQIIDGKLTVGALIACTILAGRALAPMGQVAAIFTRYYQSMQALHSIDTIMQLPTDVDVNTSYLHRPQIKGLIEFKQVDYHFPGLQPTPILNGVSFVIKPGERVALIGRIGSGKSTIAKLIMGLYRPSKGSIQIDHTDYLQLNPADLRRQIGYVPQDVVLFYGSIKDNIRMGTPYVDDAALIKAVELSGVSQFTHNHPEGLDRQVGERGSRLSSGQRQAVAIARALVISTDVLLFDEPTASMDDVSETQLRAELKTQLTPDKTFLLITHKGSMIDLVDRIIILDAGRVVADGPKDTVINALKTGLKFK
jgi:ATP-binding cassette subfamily C protein LapB